MLQEPIEPAHCPQYPPSHVRDWRSGGRGAAECAEKKASIRGHVLLVAEAAAETSLEGGNMALAIFIPVLIISLLLGGAYIYITR